MKKYWISFLYLLFLSILPLRGQIIVNMEQDGGVYKVPCSVNGVKMKFIFDTGASVVSLSKSMATYMEDNGYLHKSDYLGKTQTQIADGSFMDVDVVNLRDFEIGELHLKDVVATVKDGQNVPLLMGQSAIEKLGRVSIDKGRLIIHQVSTSLSKEQIEVLRDEIWGFGEERQFESVISKTKELMRATPLNDSDYFMYIYALLSCKEYEQLIRVGKDWESEIFNTGSFSEFSDVIYSDIATAYAAVGSLNDAIIYYQKSLSISDDLQFRAGTLTQIASCYYDLRDKSQTEYFLKQALSAQYTYLNNYTDKECTIANVIAGDVQDETLGIIYWEYALFEEVFNKDYSQRDFYLRLSAKCGYQRAIDFCFENNINYTK